MKIISPVANLKKYVWKPENVKEFNPDKVSILFSKLPQIVFTQMESNLKLCIIGKKEVSQLEALYKLAGGNW